MRFYRFLVRFFRLVNRLYFVEVRVSGRENFPEQGPVLLAANHPSSILDSFLLATQLPRPVHYLGRSGLFRNPVIAAILRSLGAIPVYRVGEGADHGGRNLDVFDQVYELFESGGCVGIFPEGRNSVMGRVYALRKGAARMSLGAEQRNDYALGLRIVPVGVVFEDRELFMSAVLLRFGEPIAVGDYAELHRRDPEAAVEALTARMQQALREQALHVEDRQVGELSSELAEVFGEDVPLELPVGAQPGDEKPRPWAKRMLWKLLHWYRPVPETPSGNMESRFRGRQYISRVLSHAAEVEPETLDSLRNHLERYRDHCRQGHLRHAPAPPRARERLIRSRMTLYAVLVAPVALFGLVHNLVPYLVTRFAARRSGDEAVRAFTYFGVGVLAFLAFYTGLGLWLWQATEMTLPRTLVYLALLPPTGFAALHYRRNILVYRDRILLRALFWNHLELARLLREERQLLLQEFRALAQRYGEDTAVEKP